MNVSRKVLSLLLSITLLASTVVSTGAFAATGDNATVGENATATAQQGDKEKATSEAANLQEEKKELERALNTAQEQYKETTQQYTTDSWAAFQSALTNAKEVLETATTDGEITEAIERLESATAALGAAAAAKEALADAIEQADQFVNQHNAKDYTPISWNAFQTALSAAKEAQNDENATAENLTTAATKLKTAVEGLTKNSGGGSIVTPSEPTTPTDSTFVSDTTYNFGVSGRYTFKITSKNGKAPAFVVGTPGVFDVQLVKQIGDDYYYKITAVGAPGTQAGIYINGGPRLLIATVQTNPTYVKSDTTAPFKVKAGKSYVFKLTADVKPVFFAGTGSAFKVAFVKQSGRDYFFRVTAVGKTGQASGFYINYHNAPVAVATVA